VPTNPSFHIPVFPVPQLFKDSCFISALETCLIYAEVVSKNSSLIYKKNHDFEKWTYEELNNAALTKNGKIRNYPSEKNPSNNWHSSIVPINHLTMQKCFPPVFDANRIVKISDWVEKFTSFELTDPKELDTLSLGDLEELLRENGPIIITNNRPWSYNTEGGEDFNITMGRFHHDFSKTCGESTINMGGIVGSLEEEEEGVGHAATIVGLFRVGTNEYLIINDSHNNDERFQIKFENVKDKDYLDFSASSIFVVPLNNFRNEYFQYISINWKKRSIKLRQRDGEFWIKIFDYFYDHK
jgi:hypothetical protein